MTSHDDARARERAQEAILRAALGERAALVPARPATPDDLRRKAAAALHCLGWATIAAGCLALAFASPWGVAVVFAGVAVGGASEVAAPVCDDDEGERA